MEEQKEPSFLEKLKMSPADLWANYKGFLIGFGLLILVIRFQDVIFDWLVKSSKRQVEKTQKKSDSLLQEQNKANDEANRLIDEAKKLGENKPSVDENWNKK